MHDPRGFPNIRRSPANISIDDAGAVRNSHFRFSSAKILAGARRCVQQSKDTKTYPALAKAHAPVQSLGYEWSDELFWG
jgi:hypothetical protein